MREERSTCVNSKTMNEIRVGKTWTNSETNDSNVQTEVKKVAQRAQMQVDCTMIVLRVVS